MGAPGASGYGAEAMDSIAPPDWDEEGTLVQARAQVRARVEAQVADRGGAPVRWVSAADPAADLEAVAGGGDGIVVGSDLSLWRWPPHSLRRLSDLLRERHGLLVFVEPTAGFGWRRPIQLLGRRYRRDIPAELRATGLVVTTQVRLWNGPYGTYVRGEARHFDSEAIPR